jgi:CubicO group peptidase (beta-lactamase class C family)
MKPVLLVVISSLFLTISFSQSTYTLPFFKDSTRLEKVNRTKAVIDALYRQQAEKNHFPGMVYGVMVDGKLAYTGSYGYINIEKKIPANVTSAFRIASMSKSFTAMAILQLRDAGKLNLDDAAWKYIPEMKNIKYLTSDAPVITIRHLLTHAAGFPEDNPWGDRQLEDLDKDLLQTIAKVSFSNVPGIAYEYSNLGFALLGKIITNVTKMPYQQYITAHIFRPLGMTHTYYEFAKVPDSLLAHGYRWENNNWKEEALLHDGSYGAMGGIITTMEDFARYMQLQLSAWPARNGTENKILKRSSLREMQKASNFSSLNARFRFSSGRSCTTTSAYAYGLRWMEDCDNRIFVGHTGGLPGFGSNWTIMPDYGIGVVCFGNVTYAPTATFNLSILDTLVSLAGLQKKMIPPSAILEQRKKELLQLLPNWNNAQNAKIFAENFFADHSLNELKQESIALYNKAGNITTFESLQPENNLRGSFILHGEKANLRVSFTLTPENPALIQEYHIIEIPR